MQAVENLKKTKIKVYIHNILLRNNLAHLKQDERFVKNKLRVPYVVMPLKQAKSGLRYDSLRPSLVEVLLCLQGINTLVGFPLCLIKKIQKEVFVSSAQLSDVLKVYLLTHIKEDIYSKIKLCSSCKIASLCQGVPHGYVEEFRALAYPHSTHEKR